MNLSCGRLLRQYSGSRNHNSGRNDNDLYADRNGGNNCRSNYSGRHGDNGRTDSGGTAGDKP